VLNALLFGLAASSALVIGAVAGAYWSPPRPLLAAALAFASGALISALAFDLFAESFRAVEVRPYGDAAVTVCRQTAEGVYEDENGRYDINEQFRATLVFVKQQGRWLLASLHLSPIVGRP
jgi:zinc transporter ZupT